MSHHHPDAAATQMLPSSVRNEAHFAVNRPSDHMPWGWSVGIWLGLSYLLLVVLHLWLARGVTGPTVTPDEIGYLGNARLLAGYRPAAEMVTGPVYAWGYSTFIVPLVWLFGDNPHLLYRGAQVVNALLMATILPLSYAFLRTVTSFAKQPAFLAGMVASLYPPMLVTSGLAWSENLLAPLTIGWALSIWVALSAEPRPTWQRLLVVPATVFLHVSHPRYLVLVALCGLGFVIGGVTRVISRRLATLGIVTLVVGWLAGRMVTGWIAAQRWPDIAADKGSSGRLLGRLVTPSYLPKTGAGMVGQGWYLAAGSAGLVVAGALVMGWLVLRSNSQLDTRRRLSLAAIAIGLSALFTTSVLSFVSNNPRVDTLIYGRYNESFVPLLIAIGLGGVLTAKPTERWLLGKATIGITVVLTVLVLMARGWRFFDGEIVWNNILAIYAPAQLLGRSLAVPATTALALVFVALIWVLAAYKKSLWATAVVAIAFIGFAFSASQPIARFAASLYEDWEFIPELQRVIQSGDVRLIGLDDVDTSRHAGYTYHFWLPEVLFSARVHGDERVFDPDLMVGIPNRHPGETKGSQEWAEALVVAVDGRNNQAVWVRPGALYSRLRQLGALLPKNWIHERPLDHMNAHLDFLGEITTETGPAWSQHTAPNSQNNCDAIDTTISRQESIQIRSGSSTTICVKVTNSDSLYAWPTDSTWPALGVIRVGQRWFSPSESSAFSDDLSHEGGTENAVNSLFEAPYRTALPHSVWAGESVIIPVVIPAVNAEGEPLVAGEYILGVDVLQEGFRWFSEPGQEPLRLSVIVRPAE